MTAAALRRKLERIGKRVPTARVAHVLEIEDSETADEALARFNVAHSGKGYVLGVPAPCLTCDEYAVFLTEMKAGQAALVAAARSEQRSRAAAKPDLSKPTFPIGAKPLPHRFSIKRTWRPNVCPV